MGIMVFSLLWALQDSYHQPYHLHCSGNSRVLGLGVRGRSWRGWLLEGCWGFEFRLKFRMFMRLIKIIRSRDMLEKRCHGGPSIP